VNTCVLVGKRTWQSDKKLGCDLLSILQQKYGDFPEDDNGGGDVVFTNKKDDVDETVALIQREREADVDEEVDFDDI